jgi:acetoin utilization deacetylase AcuC-like enzyme
MTVITWDERFATHDMGQAAMYLPESDLVDASMPHIDNPARIVRLRDLLRRTGLESRLDFMTPEPATVEDIARVHTRAHVERMQRTVDAGGGDAGGGFTPMDGRSYDLALLSAGSVLTATRAVMSGRATNAYAMLRRSGHHAWADSGFGFCIFNNLAVAARAAQATLGVERVAIIDIDVHHGNGTEAIFIDDPSVLTVSLHQARMFPPDTGDVDVIGEGEAAGTNVNIPLPGGTGDRGYHLALDAIVAPIVREFAPDLLMVACGVDASVFDPMARLSVTAHGFRGIAERLLALADETCDGRAVFDQEGGYNPVYSPFCTLAIIEAMAGVEDPHPDPFEDFLAPSLRELEPYQLEAIEAVAAFHAQRWPAVADAIAAGR